MTRPEDIPEDVWNTAFDAMPPVNRDGYEMSPYAMVLHLGFARAILAERDSTLNRLREPPGHVTDAMAAARKASEKRNGHGNYAYRDMWIAGVDAAIRGTP